MRSQDRKFTLSNDRTTALELLRLQEAAQLANDQLEARRNFTRNNKLSYVAHAVMNIAQFLTAALDEVFHHLHHKINREMRETNPDIPDMPEERNPIFFVYPICMGISFLLCVLWLATKYLNRFPIIALIGNFLGGILMLLGGISAMGHAEKYINLNEVSDADLLYHPIFIHNFIMCIISVFGMMLYLIPAWILYDLYKWQKKHNQLSESKKSRKNLGREGHEGRERREGREGRQGRQGRCTCSHSRSPSPKPSIRSRRSNTSPDSRSSPIKNSIEDEPVILYCCCVDCHRYLKAKRKLKGNGTHEFQVVQVM